MKSKRQYTTKRNARKQAVYTAPSGQPYPAKVKQIDRKDRTVFIELEYAPGKWMPAWVSFSDIEAVSR